MPKPIKLQQKSIFAVVVLQSKKRVKHLLRFNKKHSARFFASQRYERLLTGS
jgi:hypothetical protein